MAMLSNLKQPIIAGGTFNAAQGDLHTHSYFTIEGRKGMDVLTSAIAPGAFHDSSERYDPPKCHPSTRVAVLQHIMAWINDLQKLSFFMWLHGPAGTGKSAIAQSIAELCHEANILAASFFFCRTSAGRCDESCLILTLVYQLCLTMPVIRKYVEETIEQDPLVLSRSLEAQIRRLMVNPIRRALLDENDAISLRLGPKLIIIDGLDECGTGKVQRYILSVLTIAIQEIPLPISFLVASRPEQLIQDAFHAEPLHAMTRRLVLNDSYRPNDDIKLFFRSKFDEIRQNHPLRDLLPPGWPSDSELVRLVQKSSGQFIYASTVMKYLDSPHHWPTDRLDIIFGLSNPGIDTPFSQLDALYIHIFSTVKNISRALELISFLLLSQTDMLLTPTLLESLFFLRPGDIYMILSHLHSIMNVPAPAADGTLDAIQIFHASLGDFLLDKSRSDKFYIDAGIAHANLTQYFLKHLSTTDLSLSRDSSFAEALIKHCPLSSPTPELLDDLYKFDFYRFLTTFQGRFLDRVSYVFDWLKKHSRENPSGKNLYSHHLHSYDEYLKSELLPFMIHSNPIQLMLTAVMLPQSLQHSHSLVEFLTFDLDEGSSNQFDRACRHVVFPFLWSATEQHMAKYHIMLSEFLGDPMRSKEFYIDGDKFASLATTFAKYLFGSSILSVYADNALQPSQNSSGPLTQQEFLSCAFSCLPDCLLKASPSKGLAGFLQKHGIPSNIQDNLPDGCSSEATVTAIKDYIMRCNVSKVPDNHMDQLEDMAQVVSTNDIKSWDIGPLFMFRNHIRNFGMFF